MRTRLAKRAETSASSKRNTLQRVNGMIKDVFDLEPGDLQNEQLTNSWREIYLMKALLEDLEDTFKRNNMFLDLSSEAFEAIDKLQSEIENM